MNPPTLRTERLNLVSLNLEQLLGILNGLPLKSVMGMPAAPGLVPPPVLKAIEIKVNCMQAASAAAALWHTYWLAALREERAGIGLLGFKGAPDTTGEVEIGYGISPQYEGNGYTTEAVRALVAWALDQPGCRAVTAETHRDNPASQRVLEKAGFQKETASKDTLFWRFTAE